MNTLVKLIETLQPSAGYLAIADVLEATPLMDAYDGFDWETYLNAKPRKGNSTILFQNAYAKLMLIHWPPYFRSSKHGHPERGCLLKVLSGTLVETRYDPLNTEKITGRFRLFKGGLSFIHDALAYHVVENPASYPAVSLHLYVPGFSVSRIIEPVN